MDYTEIRRRITHCRFTDHARREMEEEPLGVIYVGEVLQVLETGEIIEKYTDDKPYPSCLIVGWTEAKRPLHVVCAPGSNRRKTDHYHDLPAGLQPLGGGL